MTMMIQQMFVASLCFLLATQQITAVVNNSKTSNVEETTTNQNNTSTSSSSTNVADLVSAGTGTEAKRREAPNHAISDTYGAPNSGLDSYAPSGPSNPNLPLPVYGVPDAPSNNIVYPAPPPDIPPPPPEISSSYGTPFKTYGPPQPINNFPPPPPPPSINFGPPIRPPKPFITPSFHGPKFSRPRPQYGPPKQIFVPKGPKINYGPPKPVYGPPKPLFVPHKNNFKQQSVTILTIPNGNGPQDEYGPPLSPPVGHYGPPEPIPHGPPHPGVPAPPTPPDIKYDGWHPIPGLVSRPPSDSYGVPEEQHHGVKDFHFNVDFVPPPIESGHGLTSHSISSGYSSSQGVSDSYGAPLNAVTGSGGVASSSGDSHHDDQSLSLGLSAAGINSGQSHLSVIKSIGFELFPNTGSLSQIDGDGYLSDSYSAPPLSSYSSNGPYAAAHSYKSNGLSSPSIKPHHSSHSFHGSHNSHGSHGLSLPSSGIGLIPPSGFYGAPPSGHYGTPLLSKPNTQYGPPLNALKINPPKHPVIFREPVPVGLIESIGQHTAHKDAHGIIDSSHNNYNTGPTYIPPPIPDLTKLVKEDRPPAPTNLYSLPNPTSVISFQNLGHGSSSSGIDNFGFGEGHSQTLTSYTAPLGSVDGSYGLPLHSSQGYSFGLDNAHSGGLTVGIDNSHPPLTIDLTSETTNIGPSISHAPAPQSVAQSSPSGYGFHNPQPQQQQQQQQQQQHDCSSHKSSQLLPSLSFGVPSANSYTASLSSLTANIGGGYQSFSPALTYGSSDLQTAHSQKVSTGVSSNAIVKESQGKSYGKSLAESFGAGSELIKSQALDINNIPVQGALGSYTLQIQPADGSSTSRNSEQISHAQVLNNGLLQSILVAIEQPNKKGVTILGQPLVQLRPAPENPQYSQDAQGQHSVTNEVVVSPPTTEATTSTTETVQEEESDTDASLHLIDNNEIALYFSNIPQDTDDTKHSNVERNNTEVSAVRNGQQYGSYGAFKRNTGSEYENSSTEKEAEKD